MDVTSFATQDFNLFLTVVEMVSCVLHHVLEIVLRLPYGGRNLFQHDLVVLLPEELETDLVIGQVEVPFVVFEVGDYVRDFLGEVVYFVVGLSGVPGCTLHEFGSFIIFIQDELICVFETGLESLIFLDGLVSLVLEGSGNFESGFNVVCDISFSHISFVLGNIFS